jgi:transcriptional regulator with XRE-family HTH domain
VKLVRVIASVRERQGLKQQDVASALGLPPSYLSKIESGTRRLDVIELLHLARAMKVDAANLVREIDDSISK